MLNNTVNETNGMLTLRLQGVMHHYGISNPADPVRRTADVPTKFAVCGMIGRALGIAGRNRRDKGQFQDLIDHIEIVDIEAINRYPVNKVVDTESFEALLEEMDYTTFREDYKDVDFSETVQIEYLTDADFHVTVCCSGQYTPEMIRDALKNPVVTPALGRSDCIPARVVAL